MSKMTHYLAATALVLGVSVGGVVVAPGAHAQSSQMTPAPYGHAPKGDGQGNQSTESGQTNANGSSQSNNGNSASTSSGAAGNAGATGGANATGGAGSATGSGASR